MFRSIVNQMQHESFEDLVKHLKRHYRRAHPGESEDLHYQFIVQRLADGRSGFIKADRLEDAPSGLRVLTERLLIEDNRVCGHWIVELPPDGVEPTRWLE
jgi:hypothetical protein